MFDILGDVWYFGWKHPLASSEKQGHCLLGERRTRSQHGGCQSAISQPSRVIPKSFRSHSTLVTCRGKKWWHVTSVHRSAENFHSACSGTGASGTLRFPKSAETKRLTPPSSFTKKVRPSRGNWRMRLGTEAFFGDPHGGALGVSNFFRRNQGTAEHRPMSALKCQHQHLESGAFGHPTLNNSEFFIFPYFPERHFLAHPKIPFDTKVGRTCLTAAMWLCLKLEDAYIILHKIAMSCHVMIFHVGNNEKPICSHKIYRQPPYFNTKKRFSDSLWSPLPRSIFPMPRHGTNHPNAKPNVPCYARAFLRGQVFFDLTISYYMLFNLCYSIYITSYYMIS